MTVEGPAVHAIRSDLNSMRADDLTGGVFSPHRLVDLWHFQPHAAGVQATRFALLHTNMWAVADEDVRATYATVLYAVQLKMSALLRELRFCEALAVDVFSVGVLPVGDDVAARTAMRGFARLVSEGSLPAMPTTEVEHAKWESARVAVPQFHPYAV